VEVAARELGRLPRRHVHHPEPVPRIVVLRRPCVVLVLLALLPLLAPGLLREVGDLPAVERPLKVGNPALRIREHPRLAAVGADQPDLPLRLVGVRVLRGVVLLRVGPRPLGEERDELAVRRPARKLVGIDRCGQATRLGVGGRHQPQVGLVIALVGVELRYHVGHPLAVGGELRVAHALHGENVVAGPGLVARGRGRGEERGGEGERGEQETMLHGGASGE